MRRLLIVAAAARFRKRRLRNSPRIRQALTAQAIARVQRIDPQLGSVIALDPTAMEQARRIDASDARGPVAGQLHPRKDNIEAAGPCRPRQAASHSQTM